MEKEQQENGQQDKEWQEEQEKQQEKQTEHKKRKLLGSKVNKEDHESSDSEKNEQLKLAVEKLNLKKNKAVKFGIIAGVVAVLAIVLCICIYRVQYYKRLTVIVPIGDVTFTEKSRDEHNYYVTFNAADYNRIPSAVNEKGIKVQVAKETYDILVLKVEYDSADIIFEVPQGIAKRAGYSAESTNYQTLWTEDILAKYTSIRSIVWSAN